jgi:glycosyltransferase involved in cell wall biosynthesis
LAQRHEVHLFSILAPGDDPTTGPVSGLTASMTTAPQPPRSSGDRLRDLVATPLPDMARRLWSPAVAEKLAALVNDLHPDILQIEGIEMAPYFFALRDAGAPYGRAIYDAHNAETLLQQRAAQADARRPKRWPAAAYSAIQTAKLRRYERTLARAVDGIAAVSEPDARFLRTLAPDAPIRVVTNGVDLTLYRPDEIFPPVFTGSGPHLVFTGKMDFRPNVDAALWFAAEVLPHLKAAGVDAHFWVVGRNPHARLEALAGRSDVTVTGAVPDVRPYIVQSDVYVVPLLAGGGTRFKILESLALAKPVVSTRLGADGIPVEDGVHLALADEPRDFAQRIISLLADHQQATEMGRRGRAFIQQRFSWENIAPELEKLFLA